MKVETPAILVRLDRVARLAENTVLTLLLVGMMVLAVGQIVLREVFNTGVVWGGEVLKLMVLWMTMFAAIAACRDDRHIRVDAITHLLSENTIRYIRAFVDVFAAVVCAVVAWYTFRYLQLEIEFGDTVLIDTPAWVAHAVVPFGFAVTSYRFLVGSLKKLLGAGETAAQGGLS